MAAAAATTSVAQVALLTPSSLAKVERDCHLKCHLQQPLQRLIFSFLTHKEWSGFVAFYLQQQCSQKCRQHSVKLRTVSCASVQWRPLCYAAWPGNSGRQANFTGKMAWTCVHTLHWHWKTRSSNEQERVAGRAERVYSSQWFSSTATVVLSTCRHYPPLPL